MNEVYEFAKKKSLISAKVFTTVNHRTKQKIFPFQQLLSFFLNFVTITFALF